MKGTKIKDYPGYTITEDGTVYSYMQTKAKKLKQRVVTQSKKGYLQVSLYNEHSKRNKKGQKIPKQVYVHRLVWETFKGEIPESKQIDHIDSNPRNNNIDNLQIITPHNNMLKYLRKKWGGIGVDYFKEIREYQRQGLSTGEIAKKVGKSYTAVYRIVTNQRQVYDVVNGKRKYYLIYFDYDKFLLD